MINSRVIQVFRELFDQPPYIADTDKILDTIHEIRDDIWIHKCIAESSIAIDAADQILSAALNEEDLEIELVWSAIDKYHEAVILTRERSIEQECIALSRLGANLEVD